MILRVLTYSSFRKNVSVDGLDIFLGTSDDAKTYPKGPRTILRKKHFLNVRQTDHQRFHHI